MSIVRTDYSEKDTKEGRTATEVFTCSFDEFFYSDLLPRIGWQLPWEPCLVCTDTSVQKKGTFFNPDYPRGFSLSNQVVYTVNYSTFGFCTRKQRPNQAASWEIYLTSTMNSAQVDEYMDLSAGTRKNWKDEYQDTFEEDPPEEVPPLEMNYISTRLNVVAYADFLKYKMVNDALASVNSTEFIDWLVDTWRTGLENLDYDVFIPDVDTGDFEDSAGHWLCSVGEITQQSTNIFKYTFGFDYTIADWNAPYQGYVTTNQYPEIDFKELFTGMAETDPVCFREFTFD